MAELFYRGEEEGFEFFFRTYYPALCLFSSKLTGNIEAAKEIASNGFMKTWAKHKQLHNHSAIRAYLYKVVRNDCYKWLQQEKREARLMPELEDQSCSVEKSHLELVIQTEVISQIYHEFRHLPTGCQKVLQKLYIEGKSVAETARELKLAITTIKTQKHRGISLIRKRLGLQ